MAFVKFLDEDRIALGRAFVEHPNRDAIAAGRALLKPEDIPLKVLPDAPLTSKPLDSSGPPAWVVAPAAALIPSVSNEVNPEPLPDTTGLSPFMLKRRAQIIKRLEAERDRLAWAIEDADDGPAKEELRVEYRNVDSALREMQDSGPVRYVYAPPLTTSEPPAEAGGTPKPTTEPKPEESVSPKPPSGSASGPPKPTEGAMAPGSKPPSPAGKPGSTTGVAFAAGIPEGPGFAISGADKAKKLSDPVTAPPMVITINAISGASLNPAVVNKAIKQLLVQDIVAEGQEVTVPASQQGQQPDLARGPMEQPPPLRPAATSSPQIKIVLTSLGRSSGDAFQMTIVNEGRDPVTLRSDAFVLEPVGNVTTEAIERELALGAGRSTTTIKAYCLEFLKQPPVQGMIFRLAPVDVQRRFAGVGPIFKASHALREAGRLRPGAGDPRDAESYVDDVRQWAIWTREQGFDERSYTRAFVEHARKNVEGAGTRWTRELEQAFGRLAPGQWQAVQLVLSEARVAR
jgi:hypothetical protein